MVPRVWTNWSATGKPYASARPEAQAIKGSSTQRSRCLMQNRAEVQIQGGPSDLCPAQNDRGTSIHSDQGRPRPGSLPIARDGEGDRGMGADGRDSQPAQAVPGIARNDLRSWFLSPLLRSGSPVSQKLNHHGLASAQRATCS